MNFGGFGFTMAVISVSLPDALVKDMDKAINAGYPGRSAFVRAAVRAHLAAPDPQGHVHGSITVAYPHGHEVKVSEVRHAFHDVVLSLMHSHCDPDTCMDALLVGGPAARVQDLVRAFEQMRDVKRVQLVLV